MRHALASPFFRKKLARFRGTIVDLKAFTAKIPLTTLTELVAEKMISHDPHSLRLRKNLNPPVIFQLEYDTETALYLGLDRSDLAVYAETLRRCWSLLGVGKGDKVAIFDYGTSPLSYLAASAFTPYLGQGAADLLGCLPICNDGVSNMSRRAVEILKFACPRLLFIRSDCLEPFTVEVEREALRLSDHTNALAVAENEGLLSKRDQNAYERRLGVPIYRLLRVDAAMFFAMECPECRLLHTWKDLYFVETVDADDGKEDSLVITNWFAKTCPTIRYLSQVKGSLQPVGCARGPQDLRIAAW